jgi:hypothetical protein
MYGASDGDCFLLRNCGFTDEKTEYGTRFNRTGGGPAPDIDFDSLEKL